MHVLAAANTNSAGRRSINSSVFHENAYLEEFLETCVLYFCSIICYDWIVSIRSS
jgi:hypothetical protein